MLSPSQTNENTAPSPELPRTTLVTYGAGSVATSSFIVIPQLLLLFYMTDTLQVPAAWAAMALLLPKLWEFVLDPVIGNFSDRLETPWGRRRPLMLAGAIGFAITFALMFSVPEYADWPARFIYVALLFSICTIAYTLYSVPYIAMPAEMARDTDERTRIVSYRMVFVSIGIVLAGGLAPVLIDIGGGGREAYQNMGFIFALICFAAMLTSIIGTHRAKYTKAAEHTFTVWQQIKSGFSNKPFRILWATFIIQMISMSVATAMLPYFNKYWLRGDEISITQFFLSMTGATMLSIPIWVLISKAIGKQRAYVCSTIVQSMGASLAFWVPDIGYPAFLVAAAIFGLGSGGVQLFPFAMLPDVIDVDKAATGMNREGAFTGVWVAGEKLGLALGAATGGIVLSIAGFQESAATIVEQPESAEWAMRILVSFGPAVALLLSLWPLSVYQKQMREATRQSPIFQANSAAIQKVKT